jgi:hypothetical protein
MRLFGWGRAAGYKAIVRLSQRLDQASATRVQISSYQWLFNKLDPGARDTRCRPQRTDPRWLLNSSEFKRL